MFASDARLVDHQFEEIAEKEFTPSPDGSPLYKANHERTRLRFVAAKSIHFQGVLFRYSIFEECYFRDCRFEDCDFTGATFRNCNLRGCTFDGSRFDYCRFSHTLAPSVILQRHMPGYENVALELARSLRVNYAQTGDTAGVNRAISAELDATRVHLHKAAWSTEGYYRTKHHGWDRLGKILQYGWFRLLDLVWGHGESLPKLVRTVVICYAAVAVVVYRAEMGPLRALQDAFLISWGGNISPAVHPLFAAAAIAVRTFLLALFVTVLVRRLSRR